MAALACPSMRCTTLGLAPALMAKDAAVWRKAWAVTLGKDGSAFWQRATAPESQEACEDGGARYPPDADGHSSSSRPLPSAVTASASMTKLGSATIRLLPDFSEPTATVRPAL